MRNQSLSEVRKSVTEEDNDGCEKKCVCVDVLRVELEQCVCVGSCRFACV